MSLSRDRLDEYWSWLAVALFMLVSVDLLTTLLAAADVGVGAEANPVMAWLLRQSLPVLLAANLAAVVLAAVCFHALVAVMRNAPAGEARAVAVLVELWLGAILATGFAVFANNLAVIVHGSSLF